MFSSFILRLSTSFIEYSLASSLKITSVNASASPIVSGSIKELKAIIKRRKSVAAKKKKKMGTFHIEYKYIN